MIKRTLLDNINARLNKGKAILLFGSRQVGKSTLIENLLQGKAHIYMTGDDFNDRQLLTDASISGLKSILGKSTTIFIDEAQIIPNIGLTIKLITDHLKAVQVIATGSSAFELADKMNEPLTGRKYEFYLYPISFEEMVTHHGLLQEKRMLNHRLVYGYYPEIVTKQGEEKELLQLLAGSYLYKDLLKLEQIKKPQLLENLLKALALQIGNEVNYNELGQTIGADNKTVEKYIDLLEKAFVVFKVPAFNRNVRNELKKGKKIYFYDCGIRNAIINEFKPFEIRQDKGAIWENFIMAERMKYLHYHHIDARQYFWRTTQQQGIDLIEEMGDQLNAFEIKLYAKQKVRFSETFTGNYPHAGLHKINMENMETFLLGSEDY
jgi:predicted AAA+ superfamily ATPase